MHPIQTIMKQKEIRVNKTNQAILSLLLFVMLPGTVSFAAEQEYGSVEERRITEAIGKERQRVRQEWIKIDLRKKELKVIEEGVDKKIAEIDRKLLQLQAQQKKIEQLLARKSIAEKKRITSLAKIYAKMTPDKAAQAMSGLDEQLAADILEQMKVKPAARILDAISRQKATDLSRTYSTIPVQ